MNLPNFLVVGAPKCGTASLFWILDQHPDIFLAMVKEVHFFDYEHRYAKGTEWYSEHFSAKKNERAVGEITPDYMFYEDTPKRIHKVLGSDVKLIFVFRNPIDRAYSEYLHNHRRGMIKTDSFEEAIQLEFLQPALSFYEKRDFSFISKGLYARYVERFLDYFPKDNLLFLLFEEDFLQNRKATIERILDFVDVERLELNLNIKKNSAVIPKYKSLYKFVHAPALRRFARRVVPFHQLRKRTKWALDKLLSSKHEPMALSTVFKNQLLEQYFLEEIHRLENIINRDLQLWYKPLQEVCDMPAEDRIKQAEN